MLLSIIIPCYNEEKRIGRTLETISIYLKKQPFYSEVIIVDNGSKDMTVKVAEKYKNSIQGLRIITRNSHGKGYAVREGMLAATGTWRLFADADNSTDISQVANLLHVAEQGYDIVISSRKAPGAVILNPQPFYRVFLGTIFQGIIRIIIPLGIHDTQNGFKLFSARASEKIFPHQAVFYWSFDVELIALAKRFGYEVAEVPITWIDDDRSSMTIKGMVRALMEIILIRFYLWTRVYEK